VFITNNLYVQTDRYNAEIIVYYNSNGEITHTGRVIQAFDGTSNGICNDANLVMVRSKWDNALIVSHRGDCCPYAGWPYGNGGSVKYFAYNHAHNIQISGTNMHNKKCIGSDYCKLDIDVPHDIDCVSVNNLTHMSYCQYSGCSYQTIDSHLFDYQQYNESTHKKYCTSCNYSIYESHNWSQLNDILFVCDDCAQRARFIPIIHDGINPIDLLNNQSIILYNGNYYLIVLDN
jgi:hypothetical protein